MPLGFKQDSDMALKRHEAFFERDIIDRPPIMFSFPKANPTPGVKRTYDSFEERWLDIDARCEDMIRELENTDFLYDALPIAFPNLGPEIFSAWCGCDYAFGDTTSWTKPCVKDIETDTQKARLDMNHPLFKLLVRFTRRLIDESDGRYIVGLTDFHPGGDHLAALRDPANLAMDLLDDPDWVDYMLLRSMPEYYAAYGVFWQMIHEANMPATSWLPLAHDGTFYIPSNDFSCMISKSMFDKHFLPGIAQECKFYERSIYHLDGPGALRHLDSLLDIPELDCVQWVCGAGNEGFARWREVYRRIQNAGKGIWLICDASELSDIFDSLKPHGVFFGSVSGVSDRESAEYVVKRVTAWK